MNISISEKSKQAYEAAAKKLGITAQIPDLNILRPDLALYLTAKLMLAVIIEADKDGKIHDITDHSKRKYENYFYAEDGYKAGSSGGGLSFYAYVYDDGCSDVGARLSFNSSKEGRDNAEAYAELWEIIMLDVR
jgi:hypothetical protein